MRNTKKKSTRIAWTEENNQLLRKLYANGAAWKDILKVFPHVKKGAIAQQAFRLDIPRKKNEQVKQPAVSSLQEFMARARTEKEILSKYGQPGLDELRELTNNPPPGYRLQTCHNNYQEKTVYLEKNLSTKEIELEQKIFSFRQSENDSDYIAITIPENVNFTAIRILPIDSLAFGDYLSDSEEFKKILRKLTVKPYAFAFLNGNIIGGNNYTKESAVEIRNELKRHLAPVAHKILWAQSGPLERKMSRVDGVEPLHAICQELGIHHTSRPVRADIYWKNTTKPIEIYALHGQSQARKDGSKANAIIDAIINQNFPHFTVMGHLKEGMSNVLTVRRIDPVGLTIKEYPAYAIICPGLQKYSGSEAERKGYPPPAKGTIELVIYADNRHEASS